MKFQLTIATTTIILVSVLGVYLGQKVNQSITSYEQEKQEIKEQCLQASMMLGIPNFEYANDCFEFFTR